MDKILQSNPILEAFGNARTVRNDNSSRFGKFIELNFNRRGNLVGGLIKTYLLEKVRLPSQQSGERNFHIFYQLLSTSNEEKKLWKLSNAELYWYTNQGHTFKLKHMNDFEEFENLKHSLKTLNFDEKDQILLFNVIAGLLHLGELKFEPESNGEGSTITNDNHVLESLNNACEMLGIKNELLCQALTTRIINVRGESMTMKLTPEKASDSRGKSFSNVYIYLYFHIYIVID